MIPLLEQLRGDPLGLGARRARSARETLTPRTRTADRVVQSVCPYCAVGCGQRVYVQGRAGDPDRGRPGLARSRAAASAPRARRRRATSTSPLREYRVKYRRPYGTEWEELTLDDAMDMIADRVVATRERDLGGRDAEGNPLGARSGIANLGGATLDNEENYLIKKLFTALGRGVRSRTRPAYDTAPRSPVWGPRSGEAAPPPSSRTCRTPTAS